MSNKMKNSLIAVAVICFLITMYYAIFFKSQPTVALMPGETEPGITDKIKQLFTASPFPLQKGSNGSEVRRWQLFMYDNFHANNPKVSSQRYADGAFGPNTERDTLRMLGIPTVSEAAYSEALSLMRTPTEFKAPLMTVTQTPAIESIKKERERAAQEQKKKEMDKYHRDLWGTRSNGANVRR
jgi:hypothetical protein